MALPSRLHGVDTDELGLGKGETAASADALRRIQKQKMRGRQTDTSQPDAPLDFQPVVKEGARSIPGEVSGNAVKNKKQK